MSLDRILSYLWRRPIWKGQGRWCPLEVAWENGELVVNGPRSNQSFGSLHTVWQLAFRDLLPPDTPPDRILVLGFGAGSAARILRDGRGWKAPITGVEADPEMLRLAHQYFDADRTRDLTLVEADALDFVASDEPPADLVVVDLFHDLDLAPGVETQAFIQGLGRMTTNNGTLLFNVVEHDRTSKRRSALVLDRLNTVFGQVDGHRFHQMNRVYRARHTRPLET